MTTGAFNQIIKATQGFCSKNTRNLCYHFIRLEFHADTNEVVAVAVDGFRLSVEHAIAEVEEDFFIYVKSNIKLPANSTVLLELINDEAIIRCDGFIFGYKQPEGDFLNWQKAIPASDVQFKVLEFRSPLEPVIIRTNKTDVKSVLPVRINE